VNQWMNWRAYHLLSDVIQAGKLVEIIPTRQIISIHAEDFVVAKQSVVWSLTNPTLACMRNKSWDDKTKTAL